MKYQVGFVDNPVFDSITGLNNTTFNTSNMEAGRMASEAQMLAAWNAATDLEAQADYCCRDMVVWEAYTQIVRLNTNTLSNGIPSAGGIVVSPFGNNRISGIARKGTLYTVTFPIKWNAQLYAMLTAQTDSSGNYSNASNWRILQYRYTLDKTLVVPTNNNASRRGFFYANTGGDNGIIINNNNGWGGYVQDIASDGTVTLTDASRRTDFTVIRYYTQWTLRECADGSLLADPT